MMPKAIGLTTPGETLTIDVKVTRQLRIRFWLGLALMRLSARVMGANINVDVGD